MSSICLDPKHLCAAEVAAKLSGGLLHSAILKVDGIRGNMREHAVREEFTQ